MFKNKPNKPHITVDGREIWESRSVAVVPIVIGYYKNDVYVLVQRRGHSTDSPGKWSLPCGYLDWNENGWDAVRREVFEETSFLIDKHENELRHSNDKRPIHVNTEMDENRQNVALIYRLSFHFKELPIYVENFKTVETLEVKWIKLIDVNNYEWAFNHDKLIFKTY